MRVGIYARVSKADRDDPNSTQVQLLDCREKAAVEGWEVVDEYVDEGVSAWDTRKRRPHWERLLADVESGRVEAILAREQERLLRQLKDGMRILELHEQTGFHRLKFVIEADIDLRRARDRKDFRDRVSSAVFYSDFLSEKVKRTLDRKAASGEWHGGGRRPFGYRVEGPRPFQLLPDDREAQLIRDAARAVLGGASLHSVVTAWNDGPDPVRKDGGGRWTITDVRRVLMSEQVAGLRGGVHAAWEPILTEDEHELLSVRLTDPSRRPVERSDRQARRWALAGFVYCALCGTRMDGRAQNRQLKSGEVRERRQYVCNSANGGCSRVGITAPDLERHVLAIALEKIRSMPEPEPDDPTPVPTEREAELLRKMRELEERKDRIGDAIADGLDPRQAQRSLSKLDEQLKTLRSELGQHATRPRRTRRYLATLDAPDRFLAGELSELPPEWLHAAHDLLADLGGRVKVKPARRQGVRFDPSRVEIRWHP